jgi:hypothetical protein
VLFRSPRDRAPYAHQDRDRHGRAPYRYDDRAPYRYEWQQGYRYEWQQGRVWIPAVYESVWVPPVREMRLVWRGVWVYELVEVRRGYYADVCVQPGHWCGR